MKCITVSNMQNNETKAASRFKSQQILQLLHLNLEMPFSFKRRFGFSF